MKEYHSLWARISYLGYFRQVGAFGWESILSRNTGYRSPVNQNMSFTVSDSLRPLYFRVKKSFCWSPGQCRSLCTCSNFRIRDTDSYEIWLLKDAFNGCSYRDIFSGYINKQTARKKLYARSEASRAPRTLDGLLRCVVSLDGVGEYSRSPLMTFLEVTPESVLA